MSASGNTAGLETDDAVGEVTSSSINVSIARSSAPVDFAIDRNVYEVDAVDAERLRIGRRGEGAEDDDPEEYFDSDLMTEFVLEDKDGNRTLFLTWSGVTAAGTCIDDSATFFFESPSSSSSVESAYAKPSNSDSAGDVGAGTAGIGGDPGNASNGGTLFLNFSKKGIEGVDGVAGNGVLGGSGAGGMIRSRCKIPPPS